VFEPNVWLLLNPVPKADGQQSTQASRWRKQWRPGSRLRAKRRPAAKQHERPSRQDVKVQQGPRPAPHGAANIQPQMHTDAHR
jgi:hypothetical protein